MFWKTRTVERLLGMQGGRLAGVSKPLSTQALQAALDAPLITACLPFKRPPSFEKSSYQFKGKRGGELRTCNSEPRQPDQDFQLSAAGHRTPRS